VPKFTGYRTIDLVDPASTRSPVTIEMDEVKQFADDLKWVDNDVKKAARNANRDIAEKVVQMAKRNYWMAYHPRQYEQLVAPTIRAVQGTTPKIRVGGKRIVRRPRFRGDVSVKAEDVWPAVEFGSDRTVDSLGRRTGRKVGPRKKTGYVLFPTIRQLQPWIRGEYTREMERVLRRI
jgi:hypothetical protein